MTIHLNRFLASSIITVSMLGSLRLYVAKIYKKIEIYKKKPNYFLLNHTGVPTIVSDIAPPDELTLLCDSFPFFSFFSILFLLYRR